MNVIPMSVEEMRCMKNAYLTSFISDDGPAYATDAFLTKNISEMSGSNLYVGIVFLKTAQEQAVKFPPSISFDAGSQFYKEVELPFNDLNEPSMTLRDILQMFGCLSNKNSQTFVFISEAFTYARQSYLDYLFTIISGTKQNIKFVMDKRLYPEYLKNRLNGVLHDHLTETKNLDNARPLPMKFRFEDTNKGSAQSSDDPYMATPEIAWLPDNLCSCPQINMSLIVNCGGVFCPTETQLQTYSVLHLLTHIRMFQDVYDIHLLQRISEDLPTNSIQSLTLVVNVGLQKKIAQHLGLPFVSIV